MNISAATTETCVCENWNIINSPSMVSFLGFESNNQRQFCEWESNNHNPTTNTNTTYNPFLTTPNTFNFSANMSSSSSFDGHTIAPYPKLSDYSMAAEIIGLNLGRRTYFSSQESSMIDRLFKRPRGFYETNHAPKCQAEGCESDLSHAKHYHRRHKVCEFHSKATKVYAGGREQRFCQQCSRFHVLAEFDEGKRSCRKRLADHNRRRRKPPPSKTAEKATSEALPSSSRSEIKEKSLSSSLSTRISMSCANTSACTNGSAKDDNGSLLHVMYAMGGEQQHQQQQQRNMSNDSPTHPQRQESIFNDSPTMSLFERELFYSSSHDVTRSMGDSVGSDKVQHDQEDLQNLLHLGQALFEVDFSD